MTTAERMIDWNRWYNGLDERWRFQVVLWPLLLLGAINLGLTLAVRFPFALLVVLGILFFAAVRVPYSLGWLRSNADMSGDHPARFEIAHAPWLLGLNRWYEGLPETSRMWVYPAVLLIAGAINMVLTIAYGFPFGLLFLLALLALIVIRAPYAAGWVAPPPTMLPAEGEPTALPRADAGASAPAAITTETHAGPDLRHETPDVVTQRAEPSPDIATQRTAEPPIGSMPEGDGHRE